MRSSLTAVIEKIKSSGNRMTKTRRAMLEIVLESKAPITVGDILELLSKERINANKSTVYRELSFFMEERLVLEIDLLDGKKRYEARDDEDHHHHHLVCTECKHVSCVDICTELESMENRIKKQYDFTVTGHVFELFGVCKECQ